jgi:hypothetical protein
VPPNEYDALSAVEELNISIDPLIRKTGRAKVEVLQRERFELDIIEVYPSTANTGSPQNPINTIIVDDSNGLITLGDRIVFTSDDSLPLPLAVGTFYYIVSLDRSTSRSRTEIQVSLEADGAVLDLKPGSILIDINGDAGSPIDDDISNNPTGLINDFDTSGVQEVTFSSSKSLASSTGLTLGTQGYQEVSFSSAVASGTATGLDSGGGGSQTIHSWGGSGSPNLCNDATGLTPGVWYSITVEVDGGVGQVIYMFGTTVTDFSIAANTINTQLGITGTATCTPGVGVVVESASTGPGSSISISDGGYGLGFISSTGSSLSAASPGTDPASYETIVSVDGSNQTLDINGGNAQTFGTLVNAMNLQLTGAVVALPGGNMRITSNTTGLSSTINITDVDLFASMPLFTGFVGSPIQPTVGGTSVTYQTLIAVDGGGQQSILITGDEAQTMNELITLLNQNTTGLTINLFNGNLRFTSNSTGSNSSVDILEVGSPPGLLFNLSNVVFPFSIPVDGVNATTYTTEVDVENGPRLISIVGNEAQTFDDLLDEFNSQLPSGVLSYQPDTGSPMIVGVNLLLDAGTNTVTITNDGLFTRLGATTLGSPANSNTTGPFFNEFVPRDTGSGSHVLVPPFRDEDWIQLKAVTKNLYAARDYVPGSPLLYDVTVLSGSPLIEELSITGGGDDTVDIYVNGVLKLSDQSVPVSGLIGVSGTQPQDFITVRKERHTVTDEQAAFDPDVFDDGSNLIQYKEEYNYSQVSRLNEFGEQETVYYFWVEDKTVRDRQGNLTLRQAATDLENIPTPYVIVENLQQRLFGTGSPLLQDAPRRYTQLILRGLAGIVDDQERYILRFTRDFTLRDELRTRNYTSDLTDLTASFSRIGTEPLDLKTLHTEWTLIREKQPFNIPRALWDKVTEAMIAVSLTDSTTRVPSLSRELYDINYNTMTRYGLGDGQAFGDGELLVETLLDDLRDADNDFSPVDINVFFASNDFTTEAGLTEVMDSIYTSFPFEAVNRLFFKFLQDALTTQPELASLFKTSWVALQGTQVFQTEELFTG